MNTGISGVRGAIIGDLAGSTRESRHWKVPQRAFPLFDHDAHFTDDTILTIAMCEALMTDLDFAAAARGWARRYPHAGYGGRFRSWAFDENAQPYSSFGNGSAMRVSPVAYAADSLSNLLPVARASAAITHNHPEGVKGAQAVATALLIARQEQDLDAVVLAVEAFGYDLSLTVDGWRDATSFDVTCMGTVPAAVRCVMEAEDLE